MSNFYGLLGEKLGHSISPQIHQIIFRELKLEAAYHLFEVKAEEVEKAVEAFKVLGARGVNVTIPYKLTVMEHLDNISIEAMKIGAVNTIVFNEGKTTGHNTDYTGFNMLLDKYNIEVKNKNVVLLGNGGASKAVIQCMEDREVKDLVMVSRHASPKLLNNKYSIISYEQLKTYEKGEVIVNCTPIGMFPKVHASVVDKNIIAGYEAAVDLIYNPQETLFLKYAKEAGAKTANGLYMLIGQAIAAEELWNNIKIHSSIAEKIYKELMEKIYEQ